MKKTITAVIAVFAVLALSLVSLNNCFANGSATGIGTSVTVISGNGVVPLVKAKWETTCSLSNSESGDPNHSTSGTQVLPNNGFEAQTDIYFWAVVTDPAGVGNIANVYADVYYPGSGSDPGPNNSLKFEVELQRVTTDEPALLEFNAAYAANLVTINTLTPIGGPENTQLSDIREELNQQSAKLYRGAFHFDNCQLAGDYPVTINAVNGQNVHGFLTNTLNWLALTSLEWDFNTVNYGTVAIGIHKQIDGDRIWNTTIDSYPATIRNTGNTYLQMTIKQDDMGVGKTQTTSGEVWNVHYDARLGDGDTIHNGIGGYVNFNPAVVKGGNLSGAPATVVPEILKLCSLEKVDFSITVDKDPSMNSNHSYSGLMILGAVASPGPWTNPLP